MKNPWLDSDGGMYVRCPKCGDSCYTKDGEAYCLMCNYHFTSSLFHKVKNQGSSSSLPSCPRCGSSIFVRRANWDDKKLSVAVLGAGSGKISKRYKCTSCGYMW